MGHVRECRRSRPGILLSLSALVLAGCAPATVPTLEAQPPPATPFQPTSVPSPTAAASPSPTVASAPTPTSTEIVPLDTSCTRPDAVTVSPDGLWTAVDCHDVAAIFTVLRADGQRWTIGGEPLAASQTLTRHALYWSPDGRYLFFAQTLLRIDTDLHAYAQVGTIQRLALATGDVQPIVISVNDVAAYAVAFDAGSQRMAWVQADSPERLTVLDLRTYAPQKHTLQLELASGGDLVWSPEGDRLAMSAVRAGGGGVVVMFEPATGTVVALPTPDERVLRVLAWEPGGLVRLQDESWPAPGAWLLNLTTGDFLRQLAEDSP